MNVEDFINYVKEAKSKATFKSYMQGLIGRLLSMLRKNYVDVELLRKEGLDVTVYIRLLDPKEIGTIIG